MSLEIQTYDGYDVRQDTGISIAEAVGVVIGLRVKPVDISTNRAILNLAASTGGSRGLSLSVRFDTIRLTLATPSTTLDTASVVTAGAYHDVMAWIEGPRDGSTRNIKVWVKPTGSGSETTATNTYTSDNTPGQTLSVLFVGGDIGDKLHDIFLADGCDLTAAAAIWTSFTSTVHPDTIATVDYAWKTEGANITACYASSKGGVNLATNPTWADPIASTDNPTIGGGGGGGATFRRRFVCIGA